MKRMTGLLGAGVGLIFGVAVGAGPAAASPGDTTGGSRAEGCCKVPGPVGDLGGQLSDGAKDLGGQVSDGWKDVVQKGGDALHKAFGECDEPHADKNGVVDERPSNPDKCGDKKTPDVSVPTSTIDSTPDGPGLLDCLMEPEEFAEYEECQW